MKLLLIAPYLPWPLDAGGKYAQFTMIDFLRSRHELTFICQSNGADGYAAAALRARWPNVRLRVVPPAPRSSRQQTKTAVFNGIWQVKDWIGGKSPRLMGILKKSARAAGWEGPGSGNDLMEFQPVEPALVEAVREELERTDYDLVQLDFVDCLNLVHALPAEVPRIFVHHQIHFVFHERLLGKRLDDDPVLRPRYNELKAQEIHLLDRFDAVLALSEVDARILRDALGTTPVYCSSFGIRESTRPAAGKAARPFDGTVLYVGSEYHYPNLDAVNWFLDHVWHEIAAADSRLRFRLVGEWSEATRKRLRRHPRAECLGFVPDLESLLRTSILVVPVRIGSGVRTKILQAMMEGAPVVSTTVGAEGIPVRNGRELLIRDDPHEFAQAVLTLADDATLRRRLATSARRLAAKKFSVSAAGMTREWVYMQVVADWRAGDRKDAAKSTAEWMGRAPGATPGMEDFSAAPVALQIAEHS